MLKLAILEDSDLLRQELHLMIDDQKLGTILVSSGSSEDFICKVKLTHVDILILDIELDRGDSLSGIDVANKLKLPVIFASGKARDFLEKMEEFNLNHDVPVEYITKPVTPDKLKKILTKMQIEVSNLSKSNYVYLDFKEDKKVKIPLNTIVYLETDIDGRLSNNKKIYFTNRKPEILIDFSFSKMHELGLSPEIFITPSKAYRVSLKEIQSISKDYHLEIEVQIDEKGKKETKYIPVSESFRPSIKKLLQK